MSVRFPPVMAKSPFDSFDCYNRGVKPRGCPVTARWPIICFYESVVCTLYRQNIISGRDRL